MSRSSLSINDILLGADLKLSHKRRGTVFPSQLDLSSAFQRQAAQEDDDDYSTWEYTAPVKPVFTKSHGQRPRTTANALRSPMSTAQKIAQYHRSSTHMSAAQQVVFLYRAGLKIDLDSGIGCVGDGRGVPALSSSASSEHLSTLALESGESRESALDSEVSSWDSDGDEDQSSSELGTTAETTDTSTQAPSPIELPRLRHSASCASALAQAYAEALQETAQYPQCEAPQCPPLGLVPTAIVCPRKDCRATLRDTRALGYHIALHDIDNDLHAQRHGREQHAPRTSDLGLNLNFNLLARVHSPPYTCHACDQRFHKRQDLKDHSSRAQGCPNQSRSAPSSPIFATFHHVLTRITSH
ncbi:hypothetical protein BDP27DRAFT_1424749 [Rhodocollybia butyracea]|uniref:C2H2-type domain-containing protein n=1 Tax=Rhodocollybia butyracea TaxID=206335 RepID=A0A9P5PLK9_9AGAR|nr:hypothetical protein BDP27DRAFT_1424749 [Rhodocollybia butyracea]